ncbi:MAG: serine/threonine protein kinase [Proteobacteria bacterium]|nr:serine/threonine protein kinase [Pseudomonadota bacterium]
MIGNQTMELDDLKAAWKALDARLERQVGLNRRLLRETRADGLRRSLRPLAWGQTVQILCGSALVLFGAGIWSSYRDVPNLLVAGLLVHLVGLSMIALGVAVQVLLVRIDYGAPVVEIQQRLARVRNVYVRGGLIVGMSWWFMWIPVLMVAFAYHGIDLYKHAPEVVWYGSAVGVAGLLMTWVFHRWSRAPGREKLAAFVDAQLAGASLRRAQAALDEIAAFERE